MRGLRNLIFSMAIMMLVTIVGCDSKNSASDDKTTSKNQSTVEQLRVTDELDRRYISSDVVAAKVYVDFPDTATLHAQVVRYRSGKLGPVELTFTMTPIGSQKEFQIIYDDSGEDTRFGINGASAKIDKIAGDDRFHGRAIWRPNSTPVKIGEYIPVLGILKTDGNSIRSADPDSNMEELSKEYPFAEFICIKADIAN
jgi:hypothetical protein